jgi:citrate lyase subunit beta/citryl-CoA lyase
MLARSWLFVPGNRPERFDKACEAGADAVIVDLEDAVAPQDKASARDAVRGWLGASRSVFLRINAADTDWFDADAAIVALPGVAGVVLPKSENAAALAQLHRRAPKARLVPLVETALGLWNAREVASAPGVERLAFGSIDFQLDVGITGEGEELLYARSQIVLASRVADRKPPIDGVTVALDDPAVLCADVARARRLGFGGKLCIHPKQVAGVNAGFMPPAEEIEWARKVIAAANTAGANAVRVDGKMIDRPIIERARGVLALVEGKSA